MNKADENAIAEALGSIAVNLKYLGVGDAATEMGAIEFLAVSVKEGCEAIAASNLEIAEALNNVASAILAHGARAPIGASALRNLDKERPAAEAAEGGDRPTWDQRPGFL